MISIPEIVLSDTELRYILSRIDKKKADFNDTFQYAKVLSHILSKELSAEILMLDDPELITSELLRNGYDDINAVCAAVQKSLDERLSINLNPRKAAYPAERVQQFAHSLIDPTVSESVIKRRARAGSETITKSFHDDYIAENAKFRSKAGLDCYITRIGSHCCEWCTAVSGKYAFGEQPADIFRRHDNCDCVIVYDTEVLRGKKSNGRYTRAWDKPEVKKPSKPEIITDPQELESRKLSEIRGLTSSGGSGIIELRDDNAIYNLF